ncbi:MAG TPA: DUF4168 domain-containing protein [Nevskiaceae bacterium]|nr:DUF4168 domain-containing protein [Nevskiaceae bacterium]
MTQQFHRAAIAAAALLSIGVLAPTAFAQTPAQAPAPAQQPAAKPNLGPAPSEAELKNFVGAAVDVNKISKAAIPQIQGAKGNAERTKLQQTAETKMQAAVHEHHLTVQRYQQIAMAVQTSPQLRKKANGILKQDTNK